MQLSGHAINTPATAGASCGVFSRSMQASLQQIWSQITDHLRAHVSSELRCRNSCACAVHASSASSAAAATIAPRQHFMLT